MGSRRRTRAAECDGTPRLHARTGRRHGCMSRLWLCGRGTWHLSDSCSPCTTTATGRMPGLVPGLGMHWPCTRHMTHPCWPRQQVRSCQTSLPVIAKCRPHISFTLSTAFFAASCRGTSSRPSPARPCRAQARARRWPWSGGACSRRRRCVPWSGTAPRPSPRPPGRVRGEEGAAWGRGSGCWRAGSTQAARHAGGGHAGGRQPRSVLCLAWPPLCHASSTQMQVRNC